MRTVDLHVCIVLDVAISVFKSSVFYIWKKNFQIGPASPGPK